MFSNTATENEIYNKIFIFPKMIKKTHKNRNDKKQKCK